MRGFMKYACVLALPLLVAAGAAQAQTWPDGGNPSEGATLYDSCVPCHTLNGNGLAGKSVSDLMDKMKAYQSGTFTDAKLLGMQQVLKPLSDKQLLDLAADVAAVGFELCFARSARADSSAETRHARSLAAEAREQIFQLSQLDLQFALAASCARGEDIEYQLRVVNDAHVGYVFNIPLL